MTKYKQVSHQEFDQFLKDFPGSYVEYIRFSTPMRWNHWYGDELIAYEYDKYDEDNPSTYHIQEMGH